MKQHLKLTGLMATCLLSASVFSQDWRVDGNNAAQLGGSLTPSIGTTVNRPLVLETNGVERMRIRPNFGGLSGFIGINEPNPLFRLHIKATTIATGFGWKRGVLLSDQAALMWEGDPITNRNFFMGHASSSPVGNFYQGYSVGIGAGTPVNYASTVYVTNVPPGSNAPDASTQIFKWLLVQQDNFERRFGVNTLDPVRTAEIKNTTSNNWQLRLTHQNNSWTDFKTRNTGNLNILPQNGRVGINMNANPTHNIDVDGNARIRNVQLDAAPDALFVGNVQGVASDLEMRRLDFTGNPNDVLLGNGTWGNATPNLTANNGVSVNAGNIQLGVACNNIQGIFANQFTTDRVVTNRNFNFWIASGNNETGGVGIGGQPASAPFCNTGNTLEISANNKGKYGNANASGVRLTKLTSVSPVVANGINGVDNTKVLTVDSDGDVVLTDADNGFGSLCVGGGTPQQLAGNSEVQLNTFDFHFTGVAQDKTQNNVGIGTQCNNPLPGKLTVNQRTTNNASTGIYAINRDDSDPADGSPVSLFALATGSDAFSGCNTVAGWFEARPSLGQQNIAVCVPRSGGNVSIGFAMPDLATPANEPNVCVTHPPGTGLLSVDGDIYTTGMLTGPSDLNFKTNITPITNALEKVKKLNGIYYDYQTSSFPNLSFSNERQVGLIAQNVDTVLTEVTRYDSTLQAYTMNYARINALLIEAIKEQDDKIESKDSIISNLETRLATLEQCINEANLCSQNARTTNNADVNSGQSIELSNLNAIILDQNLPNPFAENTTIAYSIPDDVLEAQLLFYDMSGRIIKQVDITDRGESQLTVYGNNLEKGIYTYSLIADGKLIATKKMIKQ